MPAPIPYGSETLVNTTTTNAQKVPQVAALANGTYVVVWQDASLALPDNSLDSVRAQIFHADGTKFGSEFVLSEFPFAIQQDPVVTALPEGRFVAAWESYNHALQDQSGTQRRRLGRPGRPRGKRRVRVLHGARCGQCRCHRRLHSWIRHLSTLVRCLRPGRRRPRSEHLQGRRFGTCRCG